MPAAPARPAPRFKTIQTLNLDYAPVTVTQYESTRTGMRVVVVDQAGPKVNGYFALATEIHDDSGAPHTLEHLCFMGSKSYRYKGLLDKLATRAYSTTNAWTATEQTAYTLDTAGWDGFAQILPVYLEHVIVPTLTDAGCYTEVHHVDGSGQDAGVVYSEMQGVQNVSEELMELRAKRLMYPEGNGFRYETGGMMEQLRVLTADRIRAFHKEMYQPKNLCLVLTGSVNHDELLQILDDFEDTIKDDVPALAAPFKRPWIESGPTPALPKTIVDTVKFPEEDESMGEAIIGFFGPDCNDTIPATAIQVLLTYLCGSSICLLEHTLVEKEQLCSMVYYSVENRPNMVIWFSLASVETEKLADVEKRLIELLKESTRKPLDLSYMHDCITRLKRQTKLRCENAGDFFSEPIINDHLFGDRDGKHLKDLETITELDDLAKWSDKQWRDFLSKWLADANHVSVLGVPSKELSDKITKDEKARVEEQRKKLGDDGLKKLAEKLKLAQEENDKPIPDSVIQQFPVPSTDSIDFISTTSARAGSAKQAGKLDNEIQHAVDKDDDGIPLFLHFEHIPSNFVRIKIDMCTKSVPLELKPLLSLYMMNFFTTPVMRNGKRIEFEDLVLDLERETVAYGIDAEGVNGEMIMLAVNTEPENYASIISWLRTLLFDAIHDPNRLHASLTKILADIPDEKRSGSAMLHAVSDMMRFEPDSSWRARNTLSKSLYLKRVRKTLASDPDSVVSKFTTVCKALHRPENFRVSISGDVTKLAFPVSTWKQLLANTTPGKPLEPLDSRRALLSPAGRNPGSAAYIVPMATSDSSFALLTARGPDSHDHPDLPALMVACAYMDAVEGPLWVAVRGTGLAYGSSFTRTLDLGMLNFRISRSPDAFKAFAAAREQVEGFASGAIPLNRFALEGAVSEIVLGMADEQPTMAAAAAMSFANQVLRGIAKDWSHAMLRKVQAVTPEQIQEVMGKYMVPVFKPASANLVATCSQVMAEGLLERFTGVGFKVEQRTLESFRDDYGTGAVDGEEEEESSDEEMESGEETGSSDEEMK